ncbi:MAG: hypothetical protein AAFN51_01590 [Pseudomonadota bacterium]
MSFAVYTSCALNYLPKARALAESLRIFHPDVRITLCLNDTLPDWFDPSVEPFDQIWTPRDLGYGRGWIFEHNVMELCTAVKGRALQRLLAEEDAEFVAYLDPDVFLFHGLDMVETYMERASIGLVPHILSPEESDVGVRLTEMSVTEHGIYNLGHLFVRRDETGEKFANWWAARLDRYCFDERERGLFTDQRWVDLVPAIFDGVRILRQPDLDVASWNLFGRDLRQIEETRGEKLPGFTVNGTPLITYHFSGTGPTGTHRRIRDMFDPGGSAASEIERIYEGAIARHGQERLEHHPFGFDCFDNGEPIPSEVRKLYRKHGDLQRAFPDPFATPQGKLSFLEWVRQHRPGLVGGYRIEPHRLEAAFNDLFDADYYEATYPEVARALSAGTYTSAIEHYCEVGSRLHMDPNEYFISAYYFERACDHDRHLLRRNDAGMQGTLLWHYLSVGLPNGIEPIEFFDSQWYVEQNEDLATALRTGRISSPLAHFLRDGSSEGRDPGPDFIGAKFLDRSAIARKLASEAGVRGAFGAFVRQGCVLGRAVV